MPPRYVKPYVKRQKNDAADVEAICEAVTRPNMRFVEIKTCEQQGILVLHRMQLMLMRQRVQLSNAIRGHMAEYGLVAPVGRNGLQRLIAVIEDQDDARVPEVARASLAPLVRQLRLVNDQVLENDRLVRASARSTELGRRLMEVPGVGPVLASAMVATVADPTAVKSGRDLAAWIGPALGFPESEWTSTLQHARHIDEIVSKTAAIMDKYDPKKKVGLYVDEWGPWYDPPGSNPGFLVQQSSLRDAEVAALSLNIFQRHSDRVKGANIAQMINMLQAMIMTDGPKMVLTPTYHVFDMYQVFAGVPMVDAAAARGKDGKL